VRQSDEPREGACRRKALGATVALAILETEAGERTGAHAAVIARTVTGKSRATEATLVGVGEPLPGIPLSLCS
jgi:hypothetical protein